VISKLASLSVQTVLYRWIRVSRCRPEPVLRKVMW